MMPTILVADSDAGRRSSLTRILQHAMYDKLIPEHRIMESVSFGDARKRVASADFLFVGDNLREDGSGAGDSVNFKSMNFTWKLLRLFRRTRDSRTRALLYFADMFPQLSEQVPYVLPFNAINGKLLSDMLGQTSPPARAQSYWYLEIQVEVNEGLTLSPTRKKHGPLSEGGGRQKLRQISISPKDTSAIRERFSEFQMEIREPRAIETGQRLRDFTESVEHVLYELREMISANSDCRYIVFTGSRTILDFPFDFIRGAHDRGTRYLAIRKPVFWSIDDANMRDDQREGEFERHALLLVSNGASGSVFIGGKMRFYSRLPHAANERKGISRSAAGSPSSVNVTRLVNSRANYGTLQDRIGRMPSAARRYFHFCGHGVLHESDPDRSGIVVGKKSGETSGELITGKRLANILHPTGSESPHFQLAFLNCCEVAAIPQDSATRRSFYRNVISALLERPVGKHIICHRYEVGDCLARHFAKCFYSHYFEGGMEIHEAFHQAQVNAYDGEFHVKGIGRKSLHQLCDKKCDLASCDGDVGGNDKTTCLAPVLIVFDNLSKI